MDRKKTIALSYCLAAVGLLLVLPLYYKSNVSFADEIDTSISITSPVDNFRYYYNDNPLIRGKSAFSVLVGITDNDVQIASVTADSSGNFNYKPTGLSQGLHTLLAKDLVHNTISSASYIQVETEDQSKAILKAHDTQIIENDHPYYGNGVNEYDSVVGIMDGSATIENNFAAAEKAGIKMIRIINYMLDDMALPNPTNSPAAVVADGGSMTAGNYVYRYTCSNLSKTSFTYTAAETLASPATGSVTVGAGQQVTLTLDACAKSYRYNIYRRLATDPLDSEKLIGNVAKEAGLQASFVDLGASTPTTAIPASNTTRNNPRSAWPTAQSKAFMTGFGNWNDDALVAADQTLVLAKKYGIRILFTFADQHDNNTGGVKEITRNCAVGNSAFFSSSCPKDFYKQIIDKFTLRTNTISGVAYKDDPAIFGWELLNEPYETGSGGTFRGWVGEMGDYLKTKDPNHMLSTGDDGSIWFTHNHEAAYNFNNNHDFVMLGLPKSVDLLTWHGYPESTGFTFNHGHYGEYIPDPVADADWIAKYGPVSGPISIATAVNQLKLHAHYANLLNKPVVFGEWGVNWAAAGAQNWISGLSNAILDEKPDLVRGANNFSGSSFTQPLGTSWVIDGSSPDFVVNNSTTYNGHPTADFSTRLISGSNYAKKVTSKKISVTPNTPYWFEFTATNAGAREFRISLSSYYKNGVKVGDFSWGNTASFTSTNGFTAKTRFNNGVCELTMPDADQVEITIEFINGTAGDTASIGEISLYPLVAPSSSNNSTFAGTGWWAWPDAPGLSNATNVLALQSAAARFDQAAVAGLPPLHESAGSDVTVTKQSDVSLANVGDTVTYTITVENHGNSNFSNIILTDPIDVSKVTFLQADRSGITAVDPNTNLPTLSWPAFNLSSAAKETFTFQVRVK